MQRLSSEPVVLQDTEGSIDDKEMGTGLGLARSATAAAGSSLQRALQEVRCLDEAIRELEAPEHEQQGTSSPRLELFCSDAITK